MVYMAPNHNSGCLSRLPARCTWLSSPWTSKCATCTLPAVSINLAESYSSYHQKPKKGSYALYLKWLLWITSFMYLSNNFFLLRKITLAFAPISLTSTNNGDWQFQMAGPRMIWCTSGIRASQCRYPVTSHYPGDSILEKQATTPAMS